MSYPIYKQPPILEAVIVVAFGPMPYDPTVISNYYEGVKESFDGQPAQNIEASLSPSGLVSVATSIFRTDDGKFATSLSAGRLTVHALPIYSGWNQSFKQKVNLCLTEYQKASPHDLATNLTVRYINKIRVPTEAPQLADYFTIYGISGPSAPKELVGFNCTFGFRDRECNADVQVVFASSQNDRQQFDGFILDISVSKAYTDLPIGVSQAINEIEKFKTLEREIFESYITDKTRELFGDNAK